MSAKPAQVSQPRDYKMIVEKDVQIPLRDGTLLYADIFRPDSGDERVPVIMNISVYQKDKLWVPPADLEEEGQSLHELGDGQPAVVVPARLRLRARRFARRRANRRASRSRVRIRRRSISTTRSNGSPNAPWCSGNVGTLGISYHASSQWRVANLQPPSLKAIMPWEGRADQYRDQAYHGGIFALGFHRQLVAHAHRAPPARPAAQLQPRCVPQRHDVEVHAQRPRFRVLAHEQRAVGQDHGAGLQRRQLGRLLDAPARQHRGLHARRLETQEAAHPHRHALPSVPRGRRPHGPAALVRPLAEGHRHRHHGRAAGQARDPHRRQHRALSVPLRERMAARAHAVDQDVPQGRPRAVERRATRVEGDTAPDAAAKRSQAHLLRERRHQGRRGLGLVAVDHARQRRAHRRLVRDAAADRGHRGHRPDRAEALGVEHLRRHGHLRRRSATSAPTARTSAKSASTASRCPA